MALGLHFCAISILFLHADAVKRVSLDSSGRFRGPDGRVQIFHGLNVVQKSFPWHPSTGDFDPFSSLNAEDMTNLQSWGFNAIRLGVMWPGVEPVEGEYNHTYLQVIRQLVDDLYSHGIWTIVDFHQDAFTERFCGEGVPDWLLPKLEPIQRTCSGWLPEVAKIFGQCKSFEDLNYSTDPKTGFPNTKDCLSIGFDQYSRTPEVVTSWGHFFSYDSIQQKFRGYWKVVAEALKDAEGVLGYDLVNEPLNGNYFHHVELLKPGEADRQLLQPLYASIGEVIHSVDATAILMYEPVPFPDTLPAYLPVAGGVRPVGFTQGPGTNSTQALSYHIYSCGFATDKCNRKGDLPQIECDVCDDMASSAVAQRDSDAQRLGGGVFMTEFGACSGSPTCLAEIARITERADQALHSWAYWQFKYNHDITTVAGPEEGFYNTNGSLQESKVAALSRTYAPFIAGSPLTMRYDSKTGAFRLRYVTEAATSNLITSIFLNEKMNYPRGIQLSVLNGTATRSSNQVQVRAEAGLEVDVALVRQTLGPLQGSFQSKGGGVVQWNMRSTTTTGFELSSSANITWWKGLKVISDKGQVLCDLQIQDQKKISTCTLPQAHELLFNYSLEIWKAKALGIHKRVDVLDGKFLGPLLQRHTTFHWLSDKESTINFDSENPTQKSSFE